MPYLERKVKPFKTNHGITVKPRGCVDPGKLYKKCLAVIHHIASKLDIRGANPYKLKHIFTSTRVHALSTGKLLILCNFNLHHSIRTTLFY